MLAQQPDGDEREYPALLRLMEDKSFIKEQFAYYTKLQGLAERYLRETNEGSWARNGQLLANEVKGFADLIMSAKGWMLQVVQAMESIKWGCRPEAVMHLSALLEMAEHSWIALTLPDRFHCSTLLLLGWRMTVAWLPACRFTRCSIRRLLLTTTTTGWWSLPMGGWALRAL